MFYPVAGEVEPPQTSQEASVRKRAGAGTDRRRTDPVEGAPTWFARLQEPNGTRLFGGESSLPEAPGGRPSAESAGHGHRGAGEKT